MTLLQRLLLLPLLSPLLALLLLGAVNPRPWVTFRLLTWVSPAWPLGAWISVAAATGAGLSAAGTAVALRGASQPRPPRRQVRRSAVSEEPWAGESRWREPEPEQQPAQAWAGPARAAGEPSPTVSVPFRVIRRGKAQGSTATNASAAPAANSDDSWNAARDDDW